MDHIAIMNKKVCSIDDIVNGNKKIESRWYKNRIAPWNKINIGDRVFFKYSGENFTAKAKILKVLQFEKLDNEVFNKIIYMYTDSILLNNRKYDEYYKSKNYCILVFLKDAQYIEKPFRISKKGFGISSAWLCVENINKIKIVS